MTTNTSSQICCKYCSSTLVVKDGFRTNKIGGRTQRYKCRKCNKGFVEGDRRYAQRKDQRLCVLFQEYTDGKSIRGVARSVNLSHTTVARWLKAIDKELPEVKEAYEMSKEDDEPPQKRYLVYDEMWHFLERKENKLWIIKLYDSINNKLVDFILGNRDENTFLTIYKRNKNRANSTYYIDNWTTFETVLKANNERYVIGKENTYPIEQHNSNTRHYLGRFIRRTKNVSRSEQMVAISIKLMTLRHEHPHLVAQYLTPIFPRVGIAA